jgi:RNA polymerase sigma-70 factor, ECF subfamily
MRYLNNPYDAEDAVQDALLLAYRHIERFQGRSQMSTWMTAIVINSARMQLRARTRRATLPLEGDSIRTKAMVSKRSRDSGPTPEQAFEQSELCELVSRLIETLSPAERSTIRLRQQEGLSTKQAAEKTGMLEATLKARMARTRNKLIYRFQAVVNRNRSGKAPWRPIGSGVTLFSPARVGVY